MNIQKEILKLDEKIRKCHAKGDYIGELNALKEKTRLTAPEIERLRMSEALNKEQQADACNNFLRLLFFCDLAYNEAMTFTSYIHKYGLASVDVVELAKKHTKGLARIVQTVDGPNDIKLSEHYAMMESELEDEFADKIQEKANEILHKYIKFN